MRNTLGLALLLSSASAAPTTWHHDTLVQPTDHNDTDALVHASQTPGYSCRNFENQILRTLPGAPNGAATRRYACRDYRPHIVGAPIPAPRPTPPDWWVPGQRPFIAHQLYTQCPPWLPGFRTGDETPGRHGGGVDGFGCRRDAVTLAARYVTPSNRCGEGGRCPRGGQYASCVTFNKAQIYPDYSRAGFCITAGPQGGPTPQTSYVEMMLANNANVQDFFLMAARWTNSAEPARMTCDSFCKKCDRATEFCPDTATSPIASGEHGNCDCHCREGSAAADFDRCTTVSRSVCAASYCGANGAGVFTATNGADEGTCACTCNQGAPRAVRRASRATRTRQPSHLTPVLLPRFRRLLRAQLRAPGGHPVRYQRLQRQDARHGARRPPDGCPRHAPQLPVQLRHGARRSAAGKFPAPLAIALTRQPW